jgi:CRISPR-associated protein Cmr6
MTEPNLGWMYYKKLYDTQSSEKIKVNDQEKIARFSFDYLKTQERTLSADCTEVLRKRSKHFFVKKLSDYDPDSILKCKVAQNSFDLTTTYPGLLCGVGYSHGISSEADYKVGFYFDHTTGLPVIPGSSVKGVLRSAFPGFVKAVDDKMPTMEEKKERYDFFRWLIGEVNRKTEAGIQALNDEQFDQLEAFIFEGKDSEGNQISYYERDRFFDAYPVKSLGHDGCFLKNDYITPHINRENPELSPFSSPTPLQFLKVLPKVKFCFQFRLMDGGGLTAKQKEQLFKEILCFMGVGAKTNVGYGQFAEGFTDHSTEKPKTSNRTEPANYTGKVKDGISPVEAKVIDQKAKMVSMKIDNKDIEISMSGNCPIVNTLVNVRLNVDNRTGKIRNVTYMGDVKMK